MQGRDRFRRPPRVRERPRVFLARSTRSKRHVRQRSGCSANARRATGWNPCPARLLRPRTGTDLPRGRIDDRCSTPRYRTSATSPRCDGGILPVFAAIAPSSLPVHDASPPPVRAARRKSFAARLRIMHDAEARSPSGAPGAVLGTLCGCGQPPSSTAYFARDPQHAAGDHAARTRCLRRRIAGCARARSLLRSELNMRPHSPGHVTGTTPHGFSASPPLSRLLAAVASDAKPGMCTRQIPHRPKRCFIGSPGTGCRDLARLRWYTEISSPISRGGGKLTQLLPEYGN